MAAAAVGALAACGIDLIATSDPGDRGGSDGAIDGSSAEGSTRDAPGFEASPIGLPPVPDPFLDAGLDANQDNCLDGCEGGTCDAGWCILDCKGGGTCTAAPVRCPPGIPCEVHCGAGACTEGVNCTEASACRLDCFGDGSCTTRPVECSGLACKIDCSGLGACTSGVHCDAGACTIGCLAKGSCTTSPVTCNANTCTVRCGVSGEIGGDSCTQGVRCDTTALCDVGCQAHDACKGQPNQVRSGGTSIVACTGEGSCSKGTALSGAEAGVLCSGVSACATKTFCDAGKCLAHCEDHDFVSCCKAGSVCEKKENNCTISSAGCP